MTTTPNMPTLAELRARKAASGGMPTLAELRARKAQAMGAAPTRIDPPAATAGWDLNQIRAGAPAAPADPYQNYQQYQPVTDDAVLNQSNPAGDVAGGLIRSPFTLAKQVGGLAETGIAGLGAAQGAQLVRERFLNPVLDAVPQPQSFIGRAAEQAVPLGAAVLTGGATGGGLLASGAVGGLQSAGGTMADALDRGVPRGQALAESAISGATGAVTGALPLSRFAARMGGRVPVGGFAADIGLQTVAGTSQSLVDAAAQSWIESNPERWQAAVSGLGETAAMNAVLGMVGPAIGAAASRGSDNGNRGVPNQGGNVAADSGVAGASGDGRGGVVQSEAVRTPEPRVPPVVGDQGQPASDQPRDVAVAPDLGSSRLNIPEGVGRSTEQSPRVASVEAAGLPDVPPQSTPARSPEPMPEVQTGQDPLRPVEDPSLQREQAGTRVQAQTAEVPASSPNPSPESGRVGPPPAEVANPPSKPDPKKAERAYKKRGLKGDKLLNVLDLAQELRDNGGSVDDDGMVTLYHRTSPENADQIRKTGTMRGLEDGVFFSTSEKGQAEGFGDAVVVVREPVERVEIDDVFGNEAHVRIPTKRNGALVRVQVADPATPKVADATPVVAEPRLEKSPPPTPKVADATPEPGTPGFADAIIAREEARKAARKAKAEAETPKPEPTPEPAPLPDPAKMKPSEMRKELADRGVEGVPPKMTRAALEAAVTNARKFDAGEEQVDFSEKIGASEKPTPSRLEAAADRVIANQQAAKLERAKTLAEARRKAKPGQRPGSSILPDIVSDVIIVAAKAVKAGAKTVAELKAIVKEHFGNDNPEVTNRAWKLLGEARNADGTVDDTKFQNAANKLIGRPDLANPATDPAARDFVDAVDAKRNEEGKPGIRSDKSVEAEADTRLKSDYAGEKKRLIDAANSGKTPTDVDTVIARRIVEDSALKAVQDGSTADYLEALTIANAYRDQGAEVARAFRQRRDKVMNPAERAEHARAVIANLLTTPPIRIRDRLAKIRDGIMAAREAGDTAKVDRLVEAQNRTLRKAAETAETIKAKMIGLGVNPDTITNADLSNPDKVSRIARSVSESQSNGFDMLYEFWVNSILSGPHTQIANIIGNTGYGLYDFGVVQPAAALVGKTVGGKDAATFGEWSETMKSFGPSISEATRNFARTFSTEMPIFSDEARVRAGMSESPTDKIEIQGPRAAIPGVAGRIIRTPGRLLKATDEFYKTLYTKMVLHGEAYRAAVREGKKGDEARSRAAELVKDPTPDMWREAVKTAEELTFQKESTVARVAVDVKNALPGLRYIIPFVRTPLNILKSGLGLSPLGSFATVAKVARAGLVKMDWAPDTGWTYTRREFAKDLTTNLLSVGAAGLVLGLMDEKEPYITGSAVRAAGERAAQYRNAPPYSIRIGGSWYSYSRVEPFATALATTVDLLDAYRSASEPETKAAALAKAMQSIGRQGLDKTFLKGVGDMYGAIESQSGTGKETLQYASNFAASWVPNIYKQGVRAFDDTQRDMSVRAGEDGYAGPVLSNAVQKAFWSKALPERVDIWGRTIKNQPTGNVATDVLYRLLVPVQKTPAGESLPVDRMLMNWNNKIENGDGSQRPWWPVAPDNVVTVSGKKYRLTPDEYVRMNKEAGQRALKLFGSPSESRIANPKKFEIDLIQKHLETSRALVVRKIIADRKTKPDPK